MKPLRCSTTNLVDVFTKMGGSGHGERVYRHTHMHLCSQGRSIPLAPGAGRVEDGKERKMQNALRKVTTGKSLKLRIDLPLQMY